MAKEKERKGGEGEPEPMQKFANYAVSFVREKGEQMMRGELKPTGVSPNDLYFLALSLQCAENKRDLEMIKKELGL